MNSVELNSSFKNCQRPKWSFTKDIRFKNPKPYCQVLTYDSNTTKQKRAITIGHSQRNPIVDAIKQNPSPNSYQIDSQFNQFKKQKRGFSFGCGRNDSKFLNYQHLLEKTPAPTDYEISRRNKRSCAYSLRHRTNPNYFDALCDKNLIPYPKYYQQSNQMSKKFINLKQKILKFKKFKNQSSERNNYYSEKQNQLHIIQSKSIENKQEFSCCLKNHNYVSKIRPKKYKINIKQNFDDKVNNNNQNQSQVVKQFQKQKVKCYRPLTACP